MRKLILLPLVFLATLCYSQTDNHQNIADQENYLAQLLNELRSATNDVELQEKNAIFKDEFAKLLKEDAAFNHPFTLLKTIGKVQSQDNEVRLITWNVELADFSQRYYGFVLKKDTRKDIHNVIELVQYPQGIYPKYNYETLNADSWNGCLYYQIIDIKKGNKTHYTLMGYDAHSDRSTIKLLDVLYFNGKVPKFGKPIFATDKGYTSRVYFEHSAKATMSLKYDNSREMIIFDHLSPEAPNLAEFRDYYVPDMTYDAYTFDGNKWQLKEDIVALNKKDHQVKVMAYDPESDTSVVIDNKNKWIDPTDKNAPIESIGHRAVKVEDEKTTSNEKKEKATKSKDRDFNGVKYSTLPEEGTKKKKKK
jgi:hypothetical protein